MFKNIVHSLVTKGLVAVINFIILIFSSKYLGFSSRGEISILILNIAIIQIINEVFTGYSLVYFIPNYNLKRLFITGLIYTLIACSLSNSVFYMINIQLPNYEWLSYFVSLLIILNTFNCVIILGKEKIKLYNFLNIIQPVILLMGLIVSTALLKNYTFSAYFFPNKFKIVCNDEDHLLELRKNYHLVAVFTKLSQHLVKHDHLSTCIDDNVRVFPANKCIWRLSKQIWMATELSVVHLSIVG
jgi:hypothetical protein